MENKNEIKPVMISAIPKNAAKILNGEKTIHLSKRAPKQDMPFKCYVYCTASANNGLLVDEHKKKKRFVHYSRSKAMDSDGDIVSGYILGEFTCVKIDEIVRSKTGKYAVKGESEEYSKDIIKRSCLSAKDWHKYFGQKNGYAWHISDLVVYDKVKRVYGFNDINGEQLYIAPKTWGYVEEK